MLNQMWVEVRLGEDWMEVRVKMMVEVCLETGRRICQVRCGWTHSLGTIMSIMGSETGRGRLKIWIIEILGSFEFLIFFVGGTSVELRSGDQH